MRILVLAWEFPPRLVGGVLGTVLANRGRRGLGDGDNQSFLEESRNGRLTPEEGMLHIAQHALHGQRDLHFGRRQHPQRGLRARLHLGGSFLCLQGTWMFASRRKEPPPSAHAFNRLRDIAQP